MIVLVSGGCKNGKSSFAENLVLSNAHSKKYYIATMIPSDDEDEKRILKHRENRKNDNWITIEVKKSLSELLVIQNDDYILFDSLTAYVLNHIIFESNNVENLDGDFDDTIVYNNIINELKTNVLNKSNVVFVTDYIYSVSSFHIDTYSYKYMKVLSNVCKYIAKVSDDVISIKYSRPIYYKKNIIS